MPLPIIHTYERLQQYLLCYRMEILSIAMQKGLNIYAIKGNWQLDNSIQSKLVAMCFAMASEIERDLISKRTKEALMTRKKREKF